jgi:hypothetical protein
MSILPAILLYYAWFLVAVDCMLIRRFLFTAGDRLADAWARSLVTVFDWLGGRALSGPGCRPRSHRGLLPKVQLELLLMASSGDLELLHGNVSFYSMCVCIAWFHMFVVYWHLIQLFQQYTW